MSKKNSKENKDETQEKIVLEGDTIKNTATGYSFFYKGQISYMIFSTFQRYKRCRMLLIEKTKK